MSSSPEIVEIDVNGVSFTREVERVEVVDLFGWSEIYFKRGGSLMVPEEVGDRILADAYADSDTTPDTEP